MIKQHKDVRVYSRDTCYLHSHPGVFNCYDLIFERDSAFEFIEELLVELKYAKLGEDVSIRIHEELESNDCD
jgi:hypothetical protein